MPVVFHQLVVEHTLGHGNVERVRVVNLVLDKAHHFAIRCSLRPGQLFIERSVRRHERDCLPLGRVAAQLVAAGLHAVLTLTVRHSVDQVREGHAVHVRDFVHAVRQVVHNPKLEDTCVVGVLLRRAEFLGVTPDRVAHMQDGRLTRTRVGVDDVDRCTRLTRKLKQWCAESSQRRKRMRFQPRCVVEVEYLAPLIKATCRNEVRGNGSSNRRRRAVERAIRRDFLIAYDKLAIVIGPTELKSHLLCLLFVL